MNKLDSLPQNAPVLISQKIAANASVNVILKPAPRLLVLVSNADVDDIDLPKQIWDAAKPRALEVLLFALCNNIEQEAQLRRKLVTLAMIVRDETVHVNFQVARGNNWLRVMLREFRPTDIIVCSSDQYTGLQGKLLSQALASKFKTPVQVLFTSHITSPPLLKITSNIIFWLGTIFILSAFFKIDAFLDSSKQEITHTILFIICILLEAGLLWIWNFLF